MFAGEEKTSLMARVADFGFHDVELLKEQPLGRGSYGAVCKAKCDELLCAAKIIHPTLFMMDETGAKNIPLEKFHQECRLLCAVKHPNIVQYLGTYCEPDTKHLVLLMELCDESLTGYLERTTCPVPYHIQVNFCHDISLALVYLHKNDLIHRDLSSNNVLLMKDLRAKITDFGMSRFIHSKLTPLTLCPGTQAYMPPESLNQSPQYSSKLDCFSLGVLAIQIITRKFPDPGERFESIASSDSPTGILLRPIPEEKRRASHISLIPASHPFRHLITQCLSYKEQQRPTAVEICRSVVELEGSVPYIESAAVQTAFPAEGCSPALKPHYDDQHCSGSVVHDAELIQQLSKRLEEAETKQRNAESRYCDLQTIVKKESDKEVHILKEKLATMQKKLEEYQNPITQKTASDEKQVDVLTKNVPKQNSTLSLEWELSGTAPQEFYRGGAVVLGSSVYCHSSGKRIISKFDTHSNTWSTLPSCRYSHFSLAAVNSLIIAIGGYDFTTTGMLFCYNTDDTGKESWIKQHEAMPTARCNAVSVSTQRVLVVAGGDASGYNDYLDVVETMDIASGKWTEVTKLPCPHYNLSATVTSDGQLYLGGGIAAKGRNATYSCSLTDLLTPPARSGRFRPLGFSIAKRPSVWHEINSPPVTQTTIVVLNGQLVAIGGQNAQHKPMVDVYKFEKETGAWEKFSKLIVPRCRCIAGVVEGKIVCVGGQGENTIEIAVFEGATNMKCTC